VPVIVPSLSTMTPVNWPFAVAGEYKLGCRYTLLATLLNSRLKNLLVGDATPLAEKEKLVPPLG
jgi:hypothetical protein